MTVFEPTDDQCLRALHEYLLMQMHGASPLHCMRRALIMGHHEPAPGEPDLYLERAKLAFSEKRNV